MNKKWLILFAPLGIALFMWLGGYIVQHLWNWLGPGLFGLRLITFWQALGLLVLCRILFGGWGGGNHGGKRGENKRWRWQRMSPEEHEMFREWMRSRQGGLGTSGEGSREPA
jgi:hypothetical protein